MDTSGRSCFQDQTYRESAVQAASGAYRYFRQKTGRWYRRGIFTIEEERTWRVLATAVADEDEPGYVALLDRNAPA